MSNYKTLINFFSRIIKLNKIQNSNDEISEIIIKNEGEDFYMYDTDIEEPDRVIVFFKFQNIILHLIIKHRYVMEDLEVHLRFLSNLYTYGSNKLQIIYLGILIMKKKYNPHIAKL